MADFKRERKDVDVSMADSSRAQSVSPSLHGDVDATRVPSPVLGLASEAKPRLVHFAVDDPEDPKNWSAVRLSLDYSYPLF